MSNQSAPRGLQPPGVALWKSIAAKYELRPDELATLELACETEDMLATLDKAWADLGKPFLTKGSMGQDVIHPLIGERRQQASLKAGLLLKLRLPDDPGVGAQPNQHRAAAASKWSQAHGKGA